MVKRHGTYPANARVDVDYSKGKPKIKFAYPKTGKSPKKQAISQNRFGPHAIILLLIILTVCLYVPPHSINTIVPYPSECITSELFYETNMTIINHITGNQSNLQYKGIYGYNITCENKTYKISFNNVKIPGEKYIGFYNADHNSKELLIYFSIFIIFPILLFFIINRLLTRYLIKQKWYQRWLPKHQAEGWLKLRSKKYIKFKPEDVENNMVEIPCFKNVELDYKAEGDFSDKLERIKIREHQHYKYKKGKVGKKKVDVYNWYARFYFKEKPKNGFLEVIFQ